MSYFFFCFLFLSCLFPSLSYTTNLLAEISEEQYTTQFKAFTYIKTLITKGESRSVLRSKTFLCPDALLIVGNGKTFSSFYSAFGNIEIEKVALLKCTAEQEAYWSLNRSFEFRPEYADLELEDVSARVSVYDYVAGEENLIGGWNWKETYQSKGAYGSLYRVKKVDGKTMPKAPETIRLLKVIIANEQQDCATLKFQQLFSMKSDGCSML